MMHRLLLLVPTAPQPLSESMKMKMRGKAASRFVIVLLLLIVLTLPYHKKSDRARGVGERVGKGVILLPQEKTAAQGGCFFLCFQRFNRLGLYWVRC